jgi:hypothetical protein
VTDDGRDRHPGAPATIPSVSDALSEALRARPGSD